MTTLASAHSIRAKAVELLGASALPLPDLVDALAGAGLVLGADAERRVVDALAADAEFAELHDDRWVFGPVLLDGTTWTTHVPADAAADDLLVADPDLTLLASIAMDGPLELLGDGAGFLHLDELDDGDAFFGPEGWLAPHTGAMLHLDVLGDGVRVHSADAAPVPTDAQVAAARAAFERTESHDVLDRELLELPDVEFHTAPLEAMLWEALVADRDAFLAAPVAPVDDLLAASGLDRRAHLVARVGIDWSEWDRMMFRRRLAALHRLSHDQVDMVEILLGACSGVIRGEPEPLGAPDEAAKAAVLLAICLADEDVAKTFVGQHRERATDPEDLARFARLLLDVVDGEPAVGARWLLAHALDHLGDPLGAEEQLIVAVADDPDHSPAAHALAGFRSDRGDAPGAFALLRDLELDDDDELLLEVAGYALHRPRASVGRNEPCPCGSGRKYKVCHLGRERLALIERAPWLYAKARRYVHTNRFRMLVPDVARAIGAASGRPGLMLDLLDSELVDDIVLCELGVLETFVAERDALLPDDEALLAARWALVGRSLFEIDAISDDRLDLRDLRTGERIAVTNVNPSDHSGPGMLLLGRPLPIDDTWRALSGFVFVPDVYRDEMLTALDTADAYEVAEVLGRTFAPPRLENTDGEPLVLHELRYRVADPVEAAAALARSELDDNGDGQFTLVRDSANQPRTMIISLVLDGDELRVSVNSDRRADEARALMAAILPDAVLDSADVRDVEEALRDLPDSRPTEMPDLDDPEVAALLDQVIRQQELRWVDEPVPALDGMTPRAAADDPVGRVALERLLRTFGAQPVPGGFDVDRLRALLGL